MKRTIFTTREAGYVCNVTLPTIIDWIEKGHLKAHKTLGGHRRILKEDLIIFLKENNFPIPEELEYSDLKKILIVDDDPKILKSLTAVINRMSSGYKIHTASDGFEAGHLITKLNPDLVLLDIKLPGIDGLKVCKLIHKYNSKIKIIAITGYHSEAIKKKIFSAGASYYLKKPIDTEKLIQTIENLLNFQIKHFKK